MLNYEKPETWREAIAFATLAYSVTKNFPNEERFGLTNQMRRAAVSISANLAEGFSRNSRTDSARFVEIATGSAFEVVSQAFVAKKQDFPSESDFKQNYKASEKPGRTLSRLRKSLLNAA